MCTALRIGPKGHAGGWEGLQGSWETQVKGCVAQAFPDNTPVPWVSTVHISPPLPYPSHPTPPHAQALPHRPSLTPPTGSDPPTLLVLLQILVSCTKGILNDTLETPHDILKRVLPERLHSRQVPQRGVGWRWEWYVGAGVRCM